MVAVFLYSKKHGEQGAPIKTPTTTDYFSISVPLGGGKYKTSIAQLQKIVNLQVNFIKANGFNFQATAGLVGKGTTTNPLKVDLAWVESKYLNSRHWPFSQVGDPAESNLPIAGTYFSVTYPYGHSHYAPTAFVEGNGDLSVLRHVTNGESFRVVYSKWSNYRNNLNSKIVNSDTVYDIPDLEPGEYVHNVLHMSSKAMLAELWVGTTFKEYIFVNLNGTAQGRYHTFIRLGLQPIQLFEGMNDGYPIRWRHRIRSTNMMAATVNGRRYVLFPLTPGAQGDCRFQIAEVSDTGVMTLLTGLTSTNSLGFKTTNSNKFVAFNKAASRDANDLDRCYLLLDPKVSIYPVFRETGPSPFTRMTVQETKDNKLAVFAYHYGGIIAPSGYVGSFKAQYTYIIDPIAKTMVPEPQSGKDRIYKGWAMPDGSSEISGPPTILFKWDHYYAAARNVQMLPTGDRLVLWSATNATDITPSIQVLSGSGKTLQDSFNDALFDGRITAQDLSATPPTPINPIKAAYLIHDHLVVPDATLIGNLNYPYGGASKMAGTIEDRTYTLLIDQDPEGGSAGTVATLPGYNLSNERQRLDKYSLAMNVFRSKTGTLHYHNAMWSSTTAQTLAFEATINTDLTARGKYTCSKAVYDKMELGVRAAFPPSKVPGGFTEINALKWLFVPAHSSVGADHVIAKIFVSTRTPDTNEIGGYRYSPAYIAIGVLDATITVDASGNCAVTDIDTTKLAGFGLVWLSAQHSARADDARSYGSCAFMYKTDNTITGMVVGGWSTYSAYGGNHDGWLGHGFQYNRTTNAQNTLMAPGINLHKPTIHPTKGLGYVANTAAGMGAMYTFQPLDETTLLVTTARGGPYVVGTARPAEGFNLTIASPIDVYLQGVAYTIPVQTIDLSKLYPSNPNAHREAHFYIYVTVVNGEANLKVTLDLLPEHSAQVFIGHVYTYQNGIARIFTEPVSRWESARVSEEAIGSGLPASTGIYAKVDNVATVWDDFKLSANTPEEYLWTADDIYDTDGMQDTVVTASYWSSDAAGKLGLTDLDYGQPGYLQVRTSGPATSVMVNIKLPTLPAPSLEIGKQDIWVEVPIVVGADGNGSGYYLVQTWDEDEMSFRNGKYVDVTAQRQAELVQRNDTGVCIFINVVVGDGGNEWGKHCGILVDGVYAVYVPDFSYTTTMSAIIPPGSSYAVTVGSNHIGKWHELRPK